MTAVTAARTAGPEGRVVAPDISAEMLAFGRQRAAAAGLVHFLSNVVLLASATA